MGKRESKRKEALTCNFNSRPQTIREEIKGKSESNVKRLHDVIGVLRLKHLQKIALWAGGEASSPSFGAYFGYQLASSREALGIRTNDSSIISCGRCEALLQPGLSCKVRIEKNVSKGHRRCNNSLLLQNNSVYICQFCSHKNIKPGCVKGYLKTLAASKLICKRGSGTKIVNKASVTDAISPTISQSDLQKVVSVSREEMLLLSKRGSDSLRANNLGSNPESDMDATGPTVPVQCRIPVTLLAKQMQESASESVKESGSHLLRHSADLVLEADWLKKDDAVMQKMPLQESAKAPLGRIIGGTSTRKRKKEKASGDTSSVQPESSTSLLDQVNTYSVSSRRRRKSSWSSLKDLTHEEQSKRERYGDLSRIPVPFSFTQDLLTAPALRFYARGRVQAPYNDDSDELRSVWSGSDEEKTLWTGSECDDDDDIPTEAHPNERSDEYIDKLFEFNEKPKYRTLSEALKAEQEPEELSPRKQARKLAVENALKKLQKGPDGRYINVWEVMSDIDILIGAFENIVSGPEYAELREGGPKKLNIQFFKDIQASMRDPSFQFSPELKLKPKSRLVAKKKWQKAESKRRKFNKR